MSRGVLRRSVGREFLLPLLLALSLPGCLLVRTTEHVLLLREDGSGEGMLRLIDIRSDASTDSLLRNDFDALLSVYRAATVPDFELYGRKITGKRFRLRGDTLMAEVTYVFPALTAIDGLRVTKDDLALTFSADREVVSTNGDAEKTEMGGTTITWDRKERRMTYVVRERVLPGSTSLASLYRHHAR